MACFRDHSPITNRQKPSKVQVKTIPKWPAAASPPAENACNDEFIR